MEKVLASFHVSEYLGTFTFSLLLDRTEYLDFLNTKGQVFQSIEQTIFEIIIVFNFVLKMIMVEFKFVRIFKALVFSCPLRFHYVFTQLYHSN